MISEAAVGDKKQNAAECVTTFANYRTNPITNMKVEIRCPSVMGKPTYMKPVERWKTDLKKT